MEVGDEHSAHVLDGDAGFRERRPKHGLRVRGMEAGVDERVSRRPFDEIGVHAAESEWQRELDAPDARRDYRCLQRERSFAKVITGTMVFSRPVRLVA